MNITRSTSDPLAKPLLFFTWGRDTENGGKEGQMITEPKEVDAIVERGWAKIYAGNVIDLESMLAEISSKYATRLYGAAEHKVTEVTEEMVYQTFRHLKVSAPGMDAWQPKELSLFSRQNV